MKKSLYQLGQGDAFVIGKGRDIYTVSFVEKLVSGGSYDVQFELLISEGSKSIAVYEFGEHERVYDPENWFKNPSIYGSTHSTTEKDERAIIKKIFNYEIRLKR